MNNFFLLPILILFITTGCKKEPALNQTAVPNPLPTVNPTYSTPNVHAGKDIYLVFPDNSTILSGSVQYPQNIQTTLWKKVLGPASFIIESPSSSVTKVRDLEKGVYIFEFSGTDKANTSAKDTLSVFVLEKGSGTNEVIFKDIQWNCPMGCNLGISDFYKYVPTGIAFKVFVKRDNSTQWVEYVDWNIYQNYLEIFISHSELWPDDTPDVKIIY